MDSLAVPLLLQDIHKTLLAHGAMISQINAKLDRSDARAAGFESLRELLPDSLSSMMNVIKVSLVTLMERTSENNRTTSRELVDVKGQLEKVNVRLNELESPKNHAPDTMADLKASIDTLMTITAENIHSTSRDLAEVKDMIKDIEVNIKPAQQMTANEVRVTKTEAQELADKFELVIAEKILKELIKQTGSAVETINNTLNLNADRSVQSNQTFFGEFDAKIDSLLRYNQEKQRELSTVIDGLETKLDAIENEMKEMSAHVSRLITTQTSQLETAESRLINSVDKQLQFLMRDIHDVVEKEAHLTRDLVLSPATPLSPVPGNDQRSTYEFRFRVLDFKRRVRSDVEVYSCPWYIHQLGTTLRGCVRFKPDGDLVVSFSHGRFPKVVGVQPQHEKTLTFTVSVVDEWGEVGDKVLVSDEQWAVDEAAQKVFIGVWSSWAERLACDDLVQDGYVHGGLDVLVLKYGVKVL